MNMIALLVGLGPLLGWGLFPAMVSKIGGKPANQIFGATVGTLIFAIVFVIVFGIDIPTGKNLFFGILSGMGWAFAQVLIFYVYALIGSSKAMPVTTALQLLGASLWGVFALGDWPGAIDKTIGFIALAVIILGAYLTVWSEKKSSSDSAALNKAIIIMVIAEIGYWLYSAAPQAANSNGQQNFLPQAIGMVIVAGIYGIYMLFKEDMHVVTDVVSWEQIVPGFFFAFAALTYLVSAQKDMNGLATGFILSQTSVVVATLTSIYWLGQKKTSREMQVTILGLVLILVAAAVTAFI